MPRLTHPSAPTLLDEAAYLQLLTHGDAAPRQAFLASFGYRLPRIARTLATTHRALERLSPFTNTSQRSATIHLFLHVAFNSVFTSTLLLVEGFPLASGHLMRHYSEATAMALLILDDDPNVWHAYERQHERYPVHKAPQRLLQTATATRLRSLIAFDATRWGRFLKVATFYDTLSHASAMSMGFHMMFDRPGVILLGAEFDPAKRRPLSIELRRRQSALTPLAALIRATGRVLKARSAS